MGPGNCYLWPRSFNLNYGPEILFESSCFLWSITSMAMDPIAGGAKKLLKGIGDRGSPG